MSGRSLPWVVAGVAVVALVLVLVVTRTAGAGHPAPRPGVTAELVLPPAAVPRTPGALEAYTAARGAPQIMDGLFCHCDCARHFGHRSLLTCFESDHGANCDICMGEAIIAVQLAGQGQSLDTIRKAIDRQFGT